MKRILSAGLVLFLVSLSGCGGAIDPNRPKTYPVSGTVSQGGKPVADANVSFHLKDGSQGAIGVTDASGNFNLTTFTSGDGAVAGEHVVTVTKFDGPKIVPRGAGSITDTGDEPEEEEEKPTRKAARDPKSLLPAKYADPKTSGLTATVTESGENKFEFKVD